MHMHCTCVRKSRTVDVVSGYKNAIHQQQGHHLKKKKQKIKSNFQSSPRDVCHTWREVQKKKKKKIGTAADVRSSALRCGSRPKKNRKTKQSLSQVLPSCTADAKNIKCSLDPIIISASVSKSASISVFTRRVECVHS